VAVLYTPIAAYVGADTNTRHWSLVNDGHTGTGGVVIANRLQNAAAGTMAIEFPQQIAITAANAHVNAGDVLKWMSTHDGTGILDPGGNVTVVVQPDLGA
jgi:2-keto-4-pentenoate hydratase/2-oxohepta-3-ene-1,7-dioic acid hydratase in catechol pathway